MNNQLNMISGHANKKMQQYKQIGTAASTDLFHAFMPVGGNATLTTLTNLDDTDATGYNSSGIYYQNVVYFGSFKAIKMNTGTSILLHLSDQ